MYRNQKGFAKYNSISGFAHMLLLVIVVVAIGVGGYWMWRNDKLNVAVEGPTPTPTPAPSETSDLEIPKVWKTYRNEEYGFAFSYPGNQFSISESKKEFDFELTNEEKTVHTTDYYLKLTNKDDAAYLQIFISVNPVSSEGGQHLITSVEGSSLAPGEYTNFKGRQAYDITITDKELEEAYIKRIHILEDNVLWAFYIEAERKDKLPELMDQILNTFQFGAYKKLPDSDTPAAGACAEFSEVKVTVTLNDKDNIPSPRCAYVRSDQTLEIINKTDEVVEIFFAGHHLKMNPGEKGTIKDKFGEYLEKGVHSVDPGGFDLWLR